MRRNSLRWVVAVAILAAGGSPAMAAAMTTAADHERFLLYEGGTMTLSEYFRDADSSGEETDSTPAGPLEIRCTDAGCVLRGAEPEGYRGSAVDGIPLTAKGGQYFFTQQAESNSCGDPERSKFAGQLTVAPSATDILVSWTLGCSEVSSEPPTTPELTHASEEGSAAARATAYESSFSVDQTWTGVFVAGDACLLDAAGCPLDTPSPGPTTPAPERTTTTTVTPTPEPAQTSTAPTPEVTETTAPDPAETEAAIPGPSETGPPPADASMQPPARSASWTTPTVLSGLTPVSDVGITLQGVCVAAALAVVLVLLAAFPTALLNSAIDNAVAPRATAPTRPVRHLSGWWKAALGVALAAVVSGFVDPAFGLNEMSARAVGAILVALLIDVLIGWSARIWFVRRLRPGEAVTFRFVPLTLLIVVGAVVITRLTEFHPAIIFGIVAGIVFSSRVSVAQQAHTELIGAGYGFAAAVAAWAAYSLLPDQPGNPVLLFAHETLAAAAIAGIAALPILLFPARGLPGSSVFRWRRTIWGAVYFVALFAFLVLLMPMPSSWTTIERPLAAWVAIYVAYCVAAVAVWIVVKSVKARHDKVRPAGPRVTTQNASPTGRGG